MPTKVKDDPRRPYKAYITFAALLLGTLWSQLQGIEHWGSMSFQDWMTIVVPTLLGTGLVYGVGNPKITVRREPGA